MGFLDATVLEQTHWLVVLVIFVIFNPVARNYSYLEGGRNHPHAWGSIILNHSYKCWSLFGLPWSQKKNIYSYPLRFPRYGFKPQILYLWAHGHQFQFEGIVPLFCSTYLRRQCKPPIPTAIRLSHYRSALTVYHPWDHNCKQGLFPEVLKDQQFCTALNLSLNLLFCWWIPEFLSNRSQFLAEIQHFPSIARNYGWFLPDFWGPCFPHSPTASTTDSSPAESRCPAWSEAMVFSQPCYRCRQCRWVCSSGWVRFWYVLMIFVED